MSRKDMDAQFSLDDVDNLDVLFARRAEMAAQALSTQRVHRGLAYGRDAQQRVNIFPAEVAVPAPVQVFFHGGFWKSLDADLFSFLAPAFVQRGAVLAVVDYPLMPTARMTDVVAACREALLWLHANVADHGGDPERLFISGNSAGGHLVVELMDDGALKGFVRGGTAISGIYDLEPVTRSFQNDDLGLTADEVARFSPLGRELRLAAPLLLALGGDETAEFHRQSTAMAAKAGAECIVVPGTNHITVLTEALADRDAALHRAICTQMGLPDRSAGPGR